METYEKLDTFYLGRAVDPATGERQAELLLYRSRDLTTHGVILGMTGSGKTGLGIALLEEAALDGIPSLVVDPKGDMGNLLLTFPKLAPEDFAPWVDPAEAARSGISAVELAARTATLWRQGLAEWGQDGERIARLRRSAEVALYTPGSSAGRPISILSSFSAPSAELLGDRDLLQERIGAAVGGLLALLDLDADPLTSRAHILLASLLEHSWRAGVDLDLPGLVRGVQEPPFSRLGVMELESVFPKKERFGLAMALNNLIAAPGFTTWLEGVPLDIDRLLYQADGKPRVAVLSIAHLSERERTFFLTLLLGEVVSWMRGLSGTAALRALLYIDEVFGMLPPVGEPPTKRPLLTLLKQARAFGLGVVLSTQNPVDLDYKALSNCGSWFLGRLQTEQDRERVLDGLVRAAGTGLDRRQLSQQLAGLGKRTFLLHDVHREAPELFGTRWVLSYLKGPLTRQEISRLSASPGGTSAGAPVADGAAAPPTTPAVPAELEAVELGRPVLGPGIPVWALPYQGVVERVVFAPSLLGVAAVRFVDAKAGIDHVQELCLLAAVPEAGLPVRWSAAEEIAAGLDGLLREPQAGSGFAELPGAAADPRSYRAWAKELADDLYRERRLELRSSGSLGITMRPGERERDFHIRLREGARERRDGESEELRSRYAKLAERLEERLRRAAERLEKEQEQLSQKKRDTVLRVGATLLGSLFGGRSRLTGSKVATALSRASRISSEKGDVERAAEELQRLESERQELERQLQRDVEAIGDRLEAAIDQLETISLEPRRQDVRVQQVALAWVPHAAGENGFLRRI